MLFGLVLCDERFSAVCPFKWLGSFAVVCLDIEHQLVNELLFGLPNAAFKDVLTHDIKPDFDLI